jgi:SAM-dependent methyltransferase
MSTMDRLERYRRRYALIKPGWLPATARYQRWIAELLQPGSRILDLGCGRGGIVERLRDQGRWVGIDPDLLSLTEHRVPDLARGCADSTALPFASNAFDLVAASWVLEHLPSPLPVFREIARVLRPHGAFVFLTPNAEHPIPRLSLWLSKLQESQSRLVIMVYGRRPEDTFPVTYQANTLRDIGRLAAQAGLRPARVSLIDDPCYFAWDDATFKAAVGLEQLLPIQRKVHLVGHLEPMA